MVQSAKALFRATRQKPVRADAVLFGELPEQRAPESGRRDRDFYPTGQPEAIRALLARDGERIASCRGVWEPACGDGALCREIQAAGLDCIASDVEDRGHPGTIASSFYDFGHAPAEAIITNPPYCEINARDGHGRWLRYTLDLPGWTYNALLLSWDWPAARANGLGALLDAHPFSYCYLMRWKLDFTGEGAPPQRNAWFVWDRERSGPPEFRWLDREDSRQEALL